MAGLLRVERIKLSVAALLGNNTRWATECCEATDEPLLRGAGSGHVSAGRKGFVLDHEAGKNCLPFPQRA